MKILIVTPAAPRSRKGNRVTAIRWSRILKQLGHATTIAQHYAGQRCDILVAIHARRSADSIERFNQQCPDQPLILALSGTDLYGDIRTNKKAQRSLELADRMILLQPHGIGELPTRLHGKCRVIYQSMPALSKSSRRPVIAAATSKVITSTKAITTDAPTKRAPFFDVCVVGHLRPVKDPFRTAMASRALPESSRIRVLHLGGALSSSMEQRAVSEMELNSRYRWLGELPRWKTLRTVARSRLLALTSKQEGGANAISEAIVAGVPVLSSKISGSLGLLGEDYPGYFDVGDTAELTKLLMQAETEPSEFLADLTSKCLELRPLFEPARESNSWQELLAEFA